MPHVVILGTLDTKLPEILYLHSRLRALSTSSELQITLVDCGRSPSSHPEITVSQPDLVSLYAPKDAATNKLETLSRGDMIKFMIGCTINCVKDIDKDRPVHGIISAGGSGGTSLASAVMREALPIGVPKLIVSTVASGDTGPVVGETDICLMYSVVDIAGANALLKGILNNAAGAILGMASAHGQFDGERRDSDGDAKVRVGITMFGVTTPCVDTIRDYLEANFPVDVYVFHATGHGGKAMERLVSEGKLDAVLDLTTTEICDHLVGGSMSAGPTRLEAALEAGIPNTISVGATDMVNFGPKDSVPERYRDRRLFEHNPTVTLMRTTEDECSSVGRYIVDKILEFAKDRTKVRVRIPRGGVSMIATPGGVFEDQSADSALAVTLERGLEGSGVRVIKDDRDINDKGFAIDIAKDLMETIKATGLIKA